MSPCEVADPEKPAPVQQTSQEAVRSMQQPEGPRIDGLSPEGQGLDGHLSLLWTGI